MNRKCLYITHWEREVTKKAAKYVSKEIIITQIIIIPQMLSYSSRQRRKRPRAGLVREWFVSKRTHTNTYCTCIHIQAFSSNPSAHPRLPLQPRSPASLPSWAQTIALINSHPGTRRVEWSGASRGSRVSCKQNNKRGNRQETEKSRNLLERSLVKFFVTLPAFHTNSDQHGNY